jgi:helix-turn-helix protein
MPSISKTRLLEVPQARSVTLTAFDAAGTILMQPDNCWDIAIIRRAGGGLHILRTGLTTRPDVVEHAEGDEILTISFAASSFMAMMPGEAMLNEAVFLEAFGRRDFWIGPQVLEMPDFDNAEAFVGRLVRQGLVESNPLVGSLVDGAPKAMAERTMQRHFLRTTGLTYKHFSLIERAQKAMALLQQGQKAADVASALGYFDQAHMINSLRQIMGQTPGEIAARTQG